MLKDTWTDKQDGVDIASAEDINSVANAVVNLETSLDKVDNTPDSEKRVAYARDAGWAESALRAGSANNADSAMFDWNGNNIIDTYATKAEVSTALGNISTALDSIIAIQNSYIGGTSA